jgi:hypothetical protein
MIYLRTTMAEKLDRTLAIRIGKSDDLRLKEVRKPFEHIVTERALARVAMRLGLEAIAKDPALLLSAPIPQRGGARKTRKRK